MLKAKTGPQAFTSGERTDGSLVPFESLELFRKY